MNQKVVEEHHHGHFHNHETNARWVVILTAITMVLEIFIGYYSNSMALQAEGWHMSSHVFSFGLTWLTYIFIRRNTTSLNLSFQKEKLLALSGFASAIILQVIAVIMLVESISRLVNPQEIRFGEAIIVAIIGLLVNGLSIFILHDKHEKSDLNIRAAYLHVMADGLTSITAIIALMAGMYFKWFFLDAISGIIDSMVITYWAFSLIKSTGIILIDFKKQK